MEATHGPVRVDFWFDPVCPYSWTASRWLHEVQEHRPVQVHHHLMSLYLLNEHRTDITPSYRRIVETTRGPSRVAAAAAARWGEEVLDPLYTAFGEQVFDYWRHPTAEELRAAVRTGLSRAGLPLDLEAAFDAPEHDDALRASHDQAVSLAGGEVGTPVTSLDGVAFSGPVLNAIPRGEDALRVLDGAWLLTRYPQFYEVKRTRTRPPVFT